MDKIKQILKEMGLSDEQIEKFIKDAINDKFIPNHRFEEVMISQNVTSKLATLKSLKATMLLYKQKLKSCRMLTNKKTKKTLKLLRP